MAQQLDKGVLARSSPAGLAWVVSDGAWVLAPHLKILSKKIVDVATGRCPRLIVTMPPRHGKSELISRFTPAWFLGNWPTRKVMLASYADTFAAQWGRSSRHVLEEHGRQLFGITVDSEAKGGGFWEVADIKGKRTGGVMTTAGVGGALTGKGAHLLIIDDPVKNSQEAQSQIVRDAHHDWWKSTARTRLQRGAGVILVMTRWHEDDLAGRLLVDALDGGDQWELLNLPAFAEGEDALGRAEGEPLWPAMFDTETLRQTERAMGSYWFGAMYQQRPAPAEGNLFKRSTFRYFERKDGDLCIIHKDTGPQVFDARYGIKFQTCDVAATAKQDSDFTVISTWVITPEKDLLLWDRERVQYETFQLLPTFRRAFNMHKPRIVGIERLGFGLTIIQELSREGLPVMRLEPDTDKVSRALPAAARCEEGRVFFPKTAAWLDEWESELLVFPNGAHDDQVDTLAYAAILLPQLGGYVSGRAGGIERADFVQESNGEMITGGWRTAQF